MLGSRRGRATDALATADDDDRCALAGGSAGRGGQRRGVGPLTRLLALGGGAGRGGQRRGVGPLTCRLAGAAVLLCLARVWAGPLMCRLALRARRRRHWQGGQRCGVDPLGQRRGVGPLTRWLAWAAASLCSARVWAGPLMCRLALRARWRQRQQGGAAVRGRAADASACAARSPVVAPAGGGAALASLGSRRGRAAHALATADDNDGNGATGDDNDGDGVTR